MPERPIQLPLEPDPSPVEAEPMPGGSDPNESPPGWLASAWNEVREHPMAYFVLALFVVAGPIITAVLFPDAPRGAGLFGGIAFGVYACLCAMPQRFL